MQALILGVGNILLADEGFGVHAVEYLAKNYIWPDNVHLLDGGTRGLMLMSELMECDIVFILDIVLAGNQPGTAYIIENDELGKAAGLRQSMHQTGVNDILLSCELAGHRPEAVVFGFEPFDWQRVQPNLTDEAEQALPEFCKKVVEELTGRGFGPKEAIQN